MARVPTPLALALLGALTFAGCGGSSGEDPTTAAPPATPAASGSTTAAPATTAATAATADGGAATGSTVALKLLSFVPETMTVTPGTTVEWMDDNPIDHTITSGTYEVGADGLRTTETPDGTFDGKVSKKGDTFSYTFADAGTYTYYCAIHKGMNATITVAG